MTHDIESRIRQAQARMLAHAQRGERYSPVMARTYAAQMAALHAQRSAETVARMEERMGLR